MKPLGSKVTRHLVFATTTCLVSSCAIHDGGGGEGVLVRQHESVSIVERVVILDSVEATSAMVKVGSSAKLHELPLGHHVPVDFKRGLVLVEADPAGRSARISGFRITRTLNPYQPF